MAHFLEGTALNLKLEKLIQEAKLEITLVSPYIKLHPRIKEIIKTKLDNPEIKITILFRKNESDITGSINQDDFEFFKTSKNIRICYHPRLHAKYYSNEDGAILSSMNLYEYSQNNNVEFGIYVKNQGVIDLKGRILGENLELDAYHYFQKIIDNSKIIFSREPKFKSRMKGVLGSVFGKYTHSETTIDELSKLFKDSVKIKKGYCIRTGIEIPFDIKKPMSWNGFNQWVDDGRDKLQPELYCHFSGEKSKGANSLAFPVLKKYYHKVIKSSDIFEEK